ncbi:MAG TPA: ATP-binding protein [Candidatus Limnocylindria bacterium]|nr:ATP-binding protein [Candidatus Limnocylindria bacterium]
MSLDSHTAFPITPAPDAAPATRRGSHTVRYYESDTSLVEALSQFVAVGLATGEPAVVIATPTHRDGVERRLVAQRVNVAEARRAGRYVPLDAAETLARITTDGWPDPVRFGEIVGGAVGRAAAAASAAQVRAFGEMVALLWADGRREAALRLEELWNELARNHSFALVCGYPMSAFGAHHDHEAFAAISATHTQVHPTEAYMALSDSDDRLRAVAALQQKAAALETEVVHRRALEQELNAKVEQLADIDRRKDEFLAMLGHELRNPLAPVSAALEVMRLRADDPQRIGKAREVVERQIAQMTRLVDDLLDVSRITRGQIELRDESVALAALVERAVEVARPLIEERGHRLSVDLPEPPVVFRGDHSRLEQVLANLLSNAAKYTDVGGRIWLRAAVDGDGLVISVRDNGEGLTPDLRDRVFDLFVQGPDTRSMARGGLGLGLTLVRQLVQLHGGAIEALSDGPGRGSEFVMRLPYVPAMYVPVPGARAVASTGQQRRILVVDDNVDAAEALAELLREYGHNVRTAHGAGSGINEALRMRPEIVLLDISMPDADGYEVARRLRAELAGMTLVALTGYGEHRHRQKSREAGFDHHLTKPVDMRELEKLLAPSS